MLRFGLSRLSKAKTSSQSTKAQLQQMAEDSDLDGDGLAPDAIPQVGPQRRFGRVGPQKLFAENESPKDKLVAVLVTIANGSSYDEMFRENKPATVPGERVSTYYLDCCDVGVFAQYLQGSTPIPGDQVDWRQLIEDINAVATDSVTFNWECCSGCSNESFPDGGRAQKRPSRTSFGMRTETCSSGVTMELMGLALRRGFTVMCSDFSLKALINQWSEEHLGPNPFVKLGACQNRFQLEFAPGELQHEEVPQQLQVVGELCAEEGKAVVSAMSDTIVYTVNPRRKTTDRYSLKVLTVVSSIDGVPVQDGAQAGIDWEAPSTRRMPSLRTVNPLPEAMMCTAGEGENTKTGMAGHVTLTYASGGQLVTSMGHWIELTRINTSLEGVLRVAQHNFGQGEFDLLQADLGMQNSDRDREECMQKWAKKHISVSVPTRMKARTKF